MHWILGDIQSIKGRVPDDVRMDVGVPLMTPVHRVKSITYLVDSCDALERVARSINILRWAMQMQVPRMSVNDKDLASFLQTFFADSKVAVKYDTSILPYHWTAPEVPEWWPGPNYIR